MGPHVRVRHRAHCPLRTRRVNPRLGKAKRRERVRAAATCGVLDTAARAVEPALRTSPKQSTVVDIGEQRSTLDIAGLCRPRGALLREETAPPHSEVLTKRLSAEAKV